MPIDPDTQAALNKLSAQIGKLDESVRRLAGRVDALEKSGVGAVVEAIRLQTTEIRAIADAAHGPYGGRTK